VLADLADLGFVGPIAARPEELRLVAQGLRIVAELALGRHEAALPEIERLIADHPLREQFHAQRITALYRSGRQSDALAAYRELRGRLDEELGIEPSPPLQRLHQAVLVQDPVLDWIPPRVRESPAPDSLAVSDVDALRTPPRSPEPEPSGPRRAALRPVLSHLGDRWFRITAVATAILLVIGLTTLVTQILRSSPPSFPGNSIGSMNDDGSLGESMSVGRSPDGLAFGAGSLWAAYRADGTVSRIDPTMELTLAGRRQAMGQPRGAGMTAAHNAVLSRSLVGVPQGAPPSSALDASKETALMGDHTGAEPSARGDGARDLAASAAT